MLATFTKSDADTMNRILVLAAFLMAFAVLAPIQLGKVTRPDDADAGRKEPELTAANREPERRTQALGGRSARIEAGRGGHYTVEARMNGRPIEVLVDTGATLVAINESTARRLGIQLTPADFKYRVRTANGITEAAAATIKEIRIGQVIVRDVEASVSRDSALSTTLLGMSFLGKLRKVSFEGGDMILVE
jgi:aspartyl protease family protein